MRDDWSVVKQPDIWPIPRRVEIARQIVMGAPAWDQYHARVRDDAYGLNVDNGWLGNLDGNPTSDIGTGTTNRFRIRFTIDEYNSKVASVTPTLYYNYDSGGWTRVDAAATHVRPTLSSQYADNDACSSQLLTGNPGNGAFEGVGDADEVDGATGLTTIATKGDFFECEFCVYFVDANVADAKTVQFRVHDGTAALDAYTVAGPTVTITKTAAPVIVGLASTTESAFAVDWIKELTVGPATETDSVLAADWIKELAVGLASTTESALAVVANPVEWGVSLLEGSFDTSSSTSYTTGSISPTANRLLVVCVNAGQNAGTATGAHTVSGLSLTWSQVTSQFYNGNDEVNISMWVAKSGSSPGSGTLTLDVASPGGLRCLWAIYEVDGADLSGTALNAVVQYEESRDDSGDETETVTLPASVTSGNRTFACYGEQNGNATGASVESGWTEIHSDIDRENNNIIVAWRDDDTDDSVTFGTTGGVGGSIGEAALIMELAVASGAAPVTVGLASTTESAFAVSWIKDLAVGLSSEADSAFAVGWKKELTVGQALETDSAFAAVWTKVLAVGLATTANTAFAVSWIKEMLVGLSSETDSAFAVTWSAALSVDQAQETDSAFAVTAVHELAVALAQETDSAFAVTWFKEMLVGLAAEADSAFPVAYSAAELVGLAEEADSALAVTGSKLLAVGLAAEADSAFGAAARKLYTVDLATTSESALAVLWTKLLAAGLAAETDTAFPVTYNQPIAVDLALETDSAFAVNWTKLLAVGLAEETDSAFTVTAAHALTVGLPTTTDTALVVSGAKLYTLGLATETDTAYTLVGQETAYALHLTGITASGFTYKIYRITGAGLTDVTGTVPVNWQATEA